MAFFSPSSAKNVLPNLSTLEIPPSTGSTGKREWNVRVAAIGDTTRRYLLEEAGVRVDAVAEEPSAEGLVEAIRKADGT